MITTYDFEQGPSMNKQKKAAEKTTEKMNNNNKEKRSKISKKKLEEVKKIQDAMIRTAPVYIDESTAQEVNKDESLAGVDDDFSKWYDAQLKESEREEKEAQEIEAKKIREENLRKQY
ncbi:hypothetical protein K502DRAFT_325857, partial [Neoconidiobolus thromboides FSU 785]